MKRKTHQEFLQEVKEKNSNFEIFEFLTEYQNARTKITYKCKKCNTITTVLPRSLQLGNGCKYCAQHKDNKFFFDKVKEQNDEIEFLDVHYINCQSKIKCKCKKCYEIWETSAHNLMYSHSGCPYCSHKILNENNSVYATRPDLHIYFKNLQDAKNVFEFSTKKIEFICPNCNNIKITAMKNVSINGFCCNYCKDGVSYPNKVIRNFMLQTPFQNIQFEYCPDWAGRYRYDAYFEYQNKKYIVEMDGNLGHGNKQYRSAEKDIVGLQRDLEKDKLALKNNIQVIRIDCKQSNIEYIKNSMKQSILKNLIDLDKIDWKQINQQSETNLIIQVCEYYNNVTKNISKVAEHFQLNPATIRKYIHKGEEFQLCEYDYEYSEKVRLKIINT